MGLGENERKVLTVPLPLAPPPTARHPGLEGEGKMCSSPTCSLGTGAGRWDVSQGPGSGNSLDPLRTEQPSLLKGGSGGGREGPVDHQWR